MEVLLKQMILTFITAGGCGYANYYILDNLNKINISENDSNDKVFVLGLFSLINLLLCFLFTDVLKWNLVASVASTLVLTIFLSFTLFPWIIGKYTGYINKARKDSFGNGEFTPKSVRTILFDRNEVLFVYVYDLKSSELLIHGCMGWENQKNKNYEFSIYPFPGLEKLSFDEAMNKCENNDNVEAYVNVDKQIKIVIIPEPK